MAMRFAPVAFATARTALGRTGQLFEGVAKATEGAVATVESGLRRVTTRFQRLHGFIDP